MEEKTQAQKEKSPKRKHVGLIVFACAVLLAIILAVCLTGTRAMRLRLPTGSADVSAGKGTGRISAQRIPTLRLTTYSRLLQA